MFYIGTKDRSFESDTITQFGLHHWNPGLNRIFPLGIILRPDQKQRS